MSERDRDGSEGPEPVMEPAEYARRRAEAANERRGVVTTTPPEMGAVQHGLYLQGSTFFPCDRCAVGESCPGYERGGTCALEREYAAARSKQIRDALIKAGQQAELHEALIMSAVLAELRLARVTRFLSERGEFREGQDGLDYEPAAKAIPALQRELRDGLGALNLTPAAIARLEMDKPPGLDNMATTILALGQPGALGAGEDVRDAEFEAAPEGTADRRERGEGAENADTAGKGQGAKGKGATPTAQQDAQDGWQEQDGEDAATADRRERREGAESAENGNGASRGTATAEEDGEDDDEFDSGPDH